MTVHLSKYSIVLAPKHSISENSTPPKREATGQRKSSSASREENLKQMEEIQDKLYAEAENGVLIIFQALDAAGKDGAVKHVFAGLNPQVRHRL